MSLGTAGGFSPRIPYAVSLKMTDGQPANLTTQLWGFLAAVVSGSAETMFNGATRPNGIDGWRRLTHYISQNKGIRVENLRRGVKLVIAKPIPSLERIEDGIAEFENIIKEFEDAGGRNPPMPRRRTTYSKFSQATSRRYCFGSRSTIRILSEASRTT